MHVHLYVGMCMFTAYVHSVAAARVFQAVMGMREWTCMTKGVSGVLFPLKDFWPPNQKSHSCWLLPRLPSLTTGAHCACLVGFKCIGSNGYDEHSSLERCEEDRARGPHSCGD